MTGFSEKLSARWAQSGSLVCVGLDPDLDRIPAHLRTEKHPLFAFNKAIIDATHDYACCYKPQIAYYAARGLEADLELTLRYLNESYPEIPHILDAKRGDIGSTAEMYAREAFDRYGADAVTVNPFMGADTLQPFLERADKGVVVLCKTSNPGSGDIQGLRADHQEIFLRIAEQAQTRWNTNGNVSLVVGATYPEEMAKIRAAAPDLPFLVPGVGAQGGKPEDVVGAGRRADGLGLMINSSRGIIYAGNGQDFADAAGAAARTLRDEINQFRT